MEVKILDTKTVTGHAIINLITHKGKTWLIGNIYGNPQADDTQSMNIIANIAQQLADTLTNFHTDYIILAGDWNCVLRNNDTTTRVRKPQTEQALKDIINQHSLTDIFQHKSANPKLTWTCDSDHTRRARHDRVYVSHNLIHNSEVKANKTTTDHMALHCHFLKTKQGTPSWKFDDNLLTDSDYTNGLEYILRDSLIEHTTQGHQHDFSSTLTNNIQTHLDYQNNNPTFLLQAVITKINSFTKQYMKVKKQRINENTNKLHDKYLETKHQALLNPNSEEWRERLTEITLKLKHEQQKRATEASIRSKLKITEEGDKPTSYFLSLAKGSATNRDINSLTVDGENGTQQTLEGENIVKHMTERYKSIIKENTPPNISLANYMGNNYNKITKVPERFKPILTSRFTEQELKHIVQDMKNQSAPGPLGITNRFLKHIFPHISKLITKVGNHLLNDENIDNVPEWITLRNIIFIPKPDKPLNNPDS